MNVVPASEIKRRGVVVLEERLRYGSVHIIKNNHPACVVLTEKEYARLTKNAVNGGQMEFGLSAMLEKPATGHKSRDEIDALLKKERNSWRR